MSATSSVTVTNRIKTAPNFAIAGTNSFSPFTSRRASKVGLPAKTVLSPSEIPVVATTVIVLRKNTASTGLFSGQSGKGNFGFASIEAGFGQAYDNDSIVLRGRNGTAWEETRYVFVKKTIKF